MAQRSDLRSAIGQLARLGDYEPTSEKINIRPLEVKNIDHVYLDVYLFLRDLNIRIFDVMTTGSIPGIIDT